MLFKDIPGQTELKTTLVKMESANRIGHAMLFDGQKNGAQLAITLAFVQYILCRNKSNGDSCGHCESCVKLNQLAHPDVHFIFPTATTKEVAKDPSSGKFMHAWRERIVNNPYISLPEWMHAIGAEKKLGMIPTSEALEVIRSFSLKGYESPNRVMIIWRPELMNIAGLNKLLKIIEEPPENAYIFLVSERHENLPQTILSRLQRIQTLPFKSSDLITFLTPKFPDASSEEINRVANQAAGNIVHAIDEMSGTDLSEEFTNAFVEWSRMCYRADIPQLIKWSDEISRHGREWHIAFLKQSLHLIRECLVKNYGDENIQHASSGEMKFIQNFSPFIHAGNLPEMTSVFEETIQHIARNANARIIFMDLSIQMTKLIRIKNVNLSNPVLTS